MRSSKKLFMFLFMQNKKELEQTDTVKKKKSYQKSA